MIKKLKLPLLFEPDKLKHDLSLLKEDEWISHFNKSVFEGAWKGVPLRGPKGAVHPIQQLTSNPNVQDYADTAILLRCKYLPGVLANFECPLNSVRLLKLEPGSVIKEHVDYFLAFEEGSARLHIPMLTNPDVYFFHEGNRVIMNEGETWYLNFNLKHSIENRGITDRVHLVMDCTVNDWLKNLFNSASN
jgi:hypothetical protein